MASKEASIQGGCLCGAIRYEITAAPVAQGACHCRDCQYVSGGGPAHLMVLPREGVRLTKGAPHPFAGRSAQGHAGRRQFCAACGTPLLVEHAAQPGMIAVTAGSLDDPSRFKPGGHSWTSTAQPWHHINPILPQWERDRS
jgi:hypothetical protein